MDGLPRAEWQEKLGKDYKRFFGDEGLWRNDFHPEEDAHYVAPTVSTISKHGADDDVMVGDYYKLVIWHVRGFPHGKGFMPSLMSVHAHNVHDYQNGAGNGWAHWGTGQEAYDKAMKEGMEWCAKKNREFAEEMERNRREYAEHLKEQQE